MAKEKFERTKPHVNVGTIGHIDHGKTTLTAAIVKVQSKKGLAKAISYADIAKGGTVRDETKTVTIAVSHVEYEIGEAPLRARRLPRPRRLHQEHDHGRGADGRRDPGRVARSTRSCRRRASTCCSRARSVCQHIVVALNKCDAVEDPEMLDLVEMEVRELLNKYKFDGDTAKVVAGRRASRRSTATRSGRSRSASCSTALDSEIPEPVRDIDKPFLMAIEDVFSIKGRGTVVTGRIERGVIKVGEEVEIIGFRDTRKTTVTGVEMFRKLLDEGQAGDNVGVSPPRHREGRRRARSGPREAGLDHAAQEVRGRGLRPEEGRGRPSHAVLHQLPPAVLHAHDGRDRHRASCPRA